MPQELRSVIEVLRERLPDLMGPNLIGIYVYGSVLDGSFVPGRSDLDCIAVTEDGLDSSAFDRLGRCLDDALGQDAAMARVQMSLLVRERILADDPAACLHQFGRLGRSGSDGNPVIWLDFFQRGLVLHGPDPREFLPEITPAILHEALVREVGYLREEISTKPDSEWRRSAAYRAYAVLTLCRILYSKATGRVASKPAAAAWAIEHVRDATELHDLIRDAEGVSERRFAAPLPLASIERFVRYVQEVVGAGPCAGTRRRRGS